MANTKNITTDTVYMCTECHKRSRYGCNINIRYSNSGGWYPKWAGRLCEHLTADDILKHLERSV